MPKTGSEWVNLISSVTAATCAFVLALLKMLGLA